MEIGMFILILSLSNEHFDSSTQKLDIVDYIKLHIARISHNILQLISCILLRIMNLSEGCHPTRWVWWVSQQVALFSCSVSFLPTYLAVSLMELLLRFAVGPAEEALSPG
jgi:hypothetical protein